MNRIVITYRNVIFFFFPTCALNGKLALSDHTTQTIRHFAKNNDLWQSQTFISANTKKLGFNNLGFLRLLLVSICEDIILYNLVL